MKMLIDSFEIHELYGKRNYEIYFNNNKLILVGENGTGKSTVISMLHYLLTSQWNKLKQFDFKALAISINGEKHQIDKNDINEFDKYSFPSQETQFVAKKLEDFGIDAETALLDNSMEFRRHVAERRYVSASEMRHILSEIIELKRDVNTELPEKLIALKEQLKLHVLFLPTYRRIERDLDTIFPELEDQVRRFSRKISNKNNFRDHVELVEFGMSDVRSMIDNTMRHLGIHFRASLGRLTGGYLRVILRKEYEKVDVSILKDTNEDDLEEILQKIDESILSEEDQRALRKTIKKFSDDEPKSEIDKLSAHIIAQLVLLHKKQYEKEEKVRSFASVCNKYLKGKKFEFDNSNFSLPIKTIDDVDEQSEIQLSMLSSGEKQIVSLFSHLYLSDVNDFFIIIDEPELSLSVPWQKTFLPDIDASGKCSGLVAVTHSPFIYDNELEEEAHSIQDFIRNGS